MEDNSDYWTSKLAHCSYRHLQQLAKSLNLPSNVKKVYLVEMINAKKCSPPSEAERIVRRVKQERKHLRQGKKRSKRSIIPVDTSSSESLSPPISITPKRPPFMLRCSELRHHMMRSQDSSAVISTSNPNASDRVLRSCNLKLKRPFTNKFVEVNQRHVGASDRAPQMNPVRVIKKCKPNILASSYLGKDRQLVPATQIHKHHLHNSAPILVKRQRLLSGIYPIGKELVPVGGVGVRNSEGKMASIAAFIHKPTEAKCDQTISTGMRRNIELTLQDIINGNVDAHTSLHYPNTSGVITDTPDYTEVTPEATCSVYYHKKIRAEQVRERRMSTLNTRCELPRINEAFGQFRGTYDRHDVTQPLYVQVSEESERILNYPQFAKRNTSLLETVYNFKSHFLTSQPLLQLASTANTKCVYSTPVVATAAPHRPATITCAEPYTASFERESQYYGNTDSSRMNDCLRFAEQDFDFRCSEEQYRSSSSVQSQDLGANVTISDMVEDALELISQDGDYMERMGMDVRMQCVLCNWAGPRIILEYHIRKEHSNDIERQAKCEWNITYTLGSVAHQLWRSRVVEFESALYVLSVKCEPGCFMATLSSITSDPEVTTGSITVFNKVTGEPHTWTGHIQELPPSLPYDTRPGLQLDLASLDLIPNSANLKLVNGELVLQSPTKVVFGQIELNDIHIILFVKTSRVLDSTYRYVKFVRKLRALEEEQRKGAEIKLKELKDKQYSDFFISCDRKSLLNNVARRVDLCMVSYQTDLAKKKESLKELFAREEEENIRKFVVQVQAARETIWQDKKDRLAFLIAKRKKEHEERFKDTPLSKCVHVLPCLVKLRAMEAQDIQLYQMREKAARQAAEKEFDKMWHEVAMKESEALAARMEYDVIQQARRDMDCHKHAMYQAEQNKINREKEKERLKQETLYFRALWDKAIKDEEEAERRRSDARHKTGRDREQAIEERKANLEKLAVEQQVTQDAWDSLAGQGLADVKAEEELIRRKERELDQCNRKMIELRDEMRASESANDDAIHEEARKYQKVVDQKRCQYLSWSQKTNRDVRKAMIDQIHDRKEAREELKKKLLEQDEYHRQLFGQLTQLAAHKDVTDAQQRKRHQENLVKQIEYNKFLKERALKEEQDQIKKCQQATEEYNQEIRRMLCRPFYSDMQHPFLRQMAGGLKMKETCPCAKPDYCAVPDAKPKS